jgi:hypothetical protein
MVIQGQGSFYSMMRITSMSLDLMIISFWISTDVLLFCENLLTYCRSLRFWLRMLGYFFCKKICVVVLHYYDYYFYKHAIYNYLFMQIMT